MYIGRFVVLGRTAEGTPYLGYRVSSRSFPNRTIRTAPDRAVVLPTPDAPPSDNPYISYNCLRTADGVTVVANGSHVDPIIDKVGLGYPLRDAIALTLLALDYEHDQYNTPRIVAAVDLSRDTGYLGIVTDEKVVVRQMAVAESEAYLIATYELTDPTPIELRGNTPQALCDAIYECDYDHPVAALAVVLDEDGLQMAARAAG